MDELVPRFILAQDALGVEAGALEGATMFADISGFTALTGQLMAHGKEGAETLAHTLRFYFDPLVDAVHQAGGWIAGFAGDALTAVFPERPNANVANEALSAAQTMHDFFRTHAVHNNDLGSFPFALKIGMSWGAVEWAILDTEGTSSSFYVRGPGVDACAAVEHHADKGDLLLDEQLFHRATGLRTESVAPGILRCLGLTPQSSHTGYLPVSDLELATVGAAIGQLRPERFVATDLAGFPAAGEFRRVAVVFLSFGPCDDLAALTSLLRDGLKRYGGTFTRLDFGDKGGNCLMFFGAPTSHENDTQRALDFVLELFAQDKLALDMRAGVTRDVMYAGFNGGTNRHEFTCLGQAVSLAARLMMVANWGQIVCSPRIVGLAARDYVFSELGEFSLKGFAVPVLLQELSHRQRSTPLHFDTSAMVGREQELDTLARAIQPIFSGVFAGFCYVDGEAGLGKSYLVQAYRSQVEGQGGASPWHWIFAPCEQTLRRSLNPFAYALREYCQIEDASPRVENEAHFHRAIDALIEALPYKAESLAAELERVRSVLAALVGLEREGSLYAQLDPKLRFENTLSAIQTWLSAESVLRPVVLQIEDGQWIDSDSLLLLQRLGQLASDVPLAVLVTCRFLDNGEPFRVPLSEETFVAVVDLNHLSTRGIRALAEGVLEEVVAPALVDFLSEKSHGNPFFAEQLVRYLKENDSLMASAEGLTPADMGLVIPDEVNAVLVARLDRLASALKRVVQVAAVLGQEFDVRVLEHIFAAADEEDEDENTESTSSFLSPVLSTELSTASLTHAHGHVEPYVVQAEIEQIWSALNEIRYLFRHALLRDAAYDMQVRTRLRWLHASAGHALEGLHAETLPLHAGELAYHFEKAESAEKALTYLEMAGDLARENYHNDEAVGYYTRLLRWPSVTGAMKRRVALSMAKVMQVLTRLDEGLSFCDIAEQAEATPSAAVTYQKAILHMLQGKLDDASTFAEQALGWARQEQSQRWEATCLTGLGGLLLYRGQIDLAWSLFEQSLEIADSIDAPELKAKSLNNMAGVAQSRRELELAIDLLQQSLVLKRACQDRWGEAITLGNLGEMYLDQGQAAQALTHLEEAQQHSAEIGSGHPPFLIHRAEALRQLGRLQEAKDAISAASAKAHEFGNPKYIVQADIYRGHIFKQEGRLNEAADAYGEAIALASTRRLKKLHKDAEQSMAALHAKT